MSEPKRRFMDRAALRGPTPTVVGADTQITGDIRGEGPYVVAGSVHGDGTLAGALHLCATGSWQGDIHVREAVIDGRVDGALIVGQKLEIGRTAVIRGRVSARTIVIARGAIVDGDIEVTSGAPIVQIDERRDGV